MDKAEADLKNSDGFKRTLKDGIEAISMAAMLARQKAINDAHEKIIDLSPSEWSSHER